MANREDDRIGIPFPNHSSDVLCSLNEQRQAGLLCDVVLVVRDHEYRTHRSILAAFSQYFKKLFAVGVDSHRHSVYEIDFVAPESLAAILEFAYTSTLTITNSNVKEILSAAQLLEIPCITSVCLEIMDATGPEGEEDEEDNLVGVGEQEPREDEEEASDISTEVSEDRDPGEEEKSQKFPLSTVRKEVQREDLSVGQHGPEITEPLREKHRDSQSLESRTLKDFSIDALLQGGLHSSTERRSLFPGLFPLAWNHNFSGIMDPNPQSNQESENRPMDLVLKKEAIKEEQREEVQPGFFHSDFLKELTGAGLCLGSDTHLGSIKNENLSSYLSFLSASHLGALFPPWSLEEDRKMKSKASQQCPVCNKVIQGAGKLPRHMRTHTGEKPYICTICEVRFTRQDKLKIHLRKHTGERPYVCLHCNSKFVHNYDLKNHLRIHTGLRPYRCEHCCKSFTRSDHLHRHVKRQSCRASRPRPRRGRKSTAWRSDNPPRLPAARDHCLSTGRTLLPASRGAAQAGLGDRWHHQGGESTGFMGLNDDVMKSLGTELLDRAQIGKAVSKRGVFAFSLDHENMLYSSTAAPWAMRLDHTHPVPGTTN